MQDRPSQRELPHAMACRHAQLWIGAPCDPAYNSADAYAAAAAWDDGRRRQARRPPEDGRTGSPGSSADGRACSPCLLLRRQPACWRCFLRACRGSGRLPAHGVRLRPPACGDRRGTRPRPYRLSRLRVLAAGCCSCDPCLLLRERHALVATEMH